MSRKVGQLGGTAGMVWDGKGGGGCSDGGSQAQWSAHPNTSDSRVHWVTLVEEASNKPFTAVTCTANLLPASR